MDAYDVGDQRVHVPAARTAGVRPLRPRDDAQKRLRAALAPVLGERKPQRVYAVGEPVPEGGLACQFPRVVEGRSAQAEFLLGALILLGGVQVAQQHVDDALLPRHELHRALLLQAVG